MKYVVSAWAESNGLVLGQLKVSDKSNEITALPELLRVLELAGCIVTVDAMGCQKKIAKEIIEADADYVLALKGNHELVPQEVKTFLDETLAETTETTPPRPVGARLSKAAANLARLETVEKDHGRVETRRYYQSAALDWFADRAKWEGLQSVGMVEAIREIGGPCAATGAWRTSCTGCWTFVFGKSRAGRAPATPPRTWRRCAGSR